MVRRVIVGVVWGVVLYFGACVVTGAVAGGIAGGKDPENAAAAGAQAGAEAVTALRGYFFFGAVAIAVTGTWAGALPGTGARPAKRHRRADWD